MGTTRQKWLLQALEEYRGRLQHYVQIEWVELKEPRESDALKRIDGEMELFEKHVSRDTFLILLDECGKGFSSIGLAEYIGNLQNRAVRECTFCVGGAFGFSPIFKKKANLLLSFSQLTFTHQMVRLLLAEQLYRAYTIMRGESYHH